MQRNRPQFITRGLCPEIVIQADIGGVTIAITEVLTDKTPAEIDARFDAYNKAINRQRAQNSLVEALVDLQARRTVLQEMPDKERAYMKGRVDERARRKVSFEAAHKAAGKRAEFQESSGQRQDLATFDAQTELDRHTKFTVEKAKIEAEIPIYEAQVARQRAIIAGAERSEVIEFPKAAEAAD